MYPFPRMPEWDTDELAGSYFSRIAHENAVPSRFAFMRWLGFDRTLCNSQIMDICDLTPTWIALADKLEIGLDAMLGQLSTKPYWACFYRQQQLPSSELEGTLLAAKELVSATSHPRLHISICCACLIEDFSHTGGMPIIHRSHQLPGTFVCHTHRVKLIDRCPGCGKVLVPRGEFVQVSLRCDECGYDLRHRREQPVGALSPLFKLAQFENKCLCSIYPPRPARDVAAFVTRVCEERDTRPIDLLRKNFSTQMNTWRRGAPVKAPDRISLWRATMPTLCACLVALGFTFDDAQKAMGQFDPATDLVGKATGRIESASQARSIVLAKIRSGEHVTWSSLEQGPQYLFWFFVLIDREWLESEIGPRPRAELHVPSVEKDRNAMFSSYSNHQRWAAYARASYRDPEWLETMRSIWDADRSTQRTLARDAVLRASLAEAMVDCFARPGRPVKFTLERAATAIGTNKANIQALGRRDPQPRDTLFESATHFRLRALLWAMNELTRQEKHVTPQLLLRTARVVVGSMERFWAASIVYLFSPKKLE